jgi:SOS-response transcriptional repressor LexA
MAIVRINGSDGVIKYFFKRDDGVVLKSENPESKPQFIPAMKWDQECAVIGVVVSYKRNMPECEN